MRGKVRTPVLMALIFISVSSSISAQGTVYSIFAGPSLSTQTLNGFERDPFFRFHIMGYIESTSEINPNSMYFSAGYHVKGSAINTYAYHDPTTGAEYEGSSTSIEFHNLSTSVGFKQRRELGDNHYSYGFGLRGDFNLKTEYGSLYSGLQGTENNFTWGVNVHAGFEYPISELVSTVIEIGFYPDLKEQIYIPYQETGYTYDDGSPVNIPETSLTNIVFEARIGFRFWRKVIYTD